MNIRMHAYRAVAASAVMLLIAAAPAGAQDLKIGFVSVPYLIQNAPQTEVIDQRLRNEFAPRQAELGEAETAFTEKAQKFERDSAVMGEAERTSMQRELEQEQRDLNRRFQTYQEDVQIRQEELLGELQNTIGRQIREFAEEEDYDLILSNVVFASEAIDITDDILEYISDDD